MQSKIHPKLASIFIVCTDLPESLRFYQKLGFALLESRSRSFILDLGGELRLHLHQPLTEQERELFQVQAGQAGECLVQSFEVESLEALEQRVEPKAILYGPATTPWGQRIIILRDPDGHRLEFREETGANRAQGS